MLRVDAVGVQMRILMKVLISALLLLERNGWRWVGLKKWFEFRGSYGDLCSLLK